MAHLSFVRVEADVENAPAVVDAIVNFLQGRPSALAIAAPPLPAAPVPQLAPAVRKPRQIRQASVKVDEKPVRCGRELVAETSLTRMEAVRLAVADGPKTNAEILAFVLKKGVEADNRNIAGSLFYLRGQNEIYKEDNDLKWYLAKKAGAR